MGKYKRKAYKALAISNDISAVFNGRILNRIWNRLILRAVRRLMK